LTIRGVVLGLLLSTAELALAQPSSAADVWLQSSETFVLADIASPDARQITAWVIETNDNHGLPFVIIDKINAQALAFDGQGVLVGAAPVLLGLAHGDESPPGIGERALRDIPPHDRITPAGRFTATFGENLAGSDILWVDYDTAISLHRVITGTAADRRLSRLATPTADDNRISYGCINVPIAFYEEIVRPLFSPTAGIVYILPETRSLEEVFPTPPADEIAGRFTRENQPETFSLTSSPAGDPLTRGHQASAYP
jgi:hypothetical protein